MRLVNSHALLLVVMSGLAMLADHARCQENPPDPERGRLVEWEGWSFRWSVRKIEGLVITDVKYRNRQVLKYAGLCELQASASERAWKS